MGTNLERPVAGTDFDRQRLNRRGWIFAISCLVAFVAVSPADAQSRRGISGNDLHQLCRDESGTGYSFCRGYIMGATDGARMHGIAPNSSASFCLPNNVNYQQIVDIVRRRLELSPRDRRQPAEMIVYSTLRERFPCEARPRD